MKQPTLPTPTDRTQPQMGSSLNLIARLPQSAAGLSCARLSLRLIFFNDAFRRHQRSHKPGTGALGGQHHEAVGWSLGSPGNVCLTGDQACFQDLDRILKISFSFNL